MIKNNKDYIDQSLDEIRLLKYINNSCRDCDEKHVLRMHDFFYYKEHLILRDEFATRLRQCFGADARFASEEGAIYQNPRTLLWRMSKPDEPGGWMGEDQLTRHTKV